MSRVVARTGLGLDLVRHSQRARIGVQLHPTSRLTVLTTKRALPDLSPHLATHDYARRAGERSGGVRASVRLGDSPLQQESVERSRGRTLWGLIQSTALADEFHVGLDGGGDGLTVVARGSVRRSMSPDGGWVRAFDVKARGKYTVDQAESCASLRRIAGEHLDGRHRWVMSCRSALVDNRVRPAEESQRGVWSG